MTTTVLQGPTGFDFPPVRVGAPVASGTLSRLSDELGSLLGHNLHRVCDAVIHPRGAAPRVQLKGLSYSIPIAYTRSPGAKALRVGVELWPGDDLGDYQTVAVTLPTGGAWIDAGGLDGSVQHRNPPAGRTAVREIVGWADVSGVTVGDLTTWLSVAGTPTSKGEGIRRVTVCEVPLATLPVDATEPGWDAAATRPGRLVVDGGAASPRGIERLWHLLDEARSGMRKHFQLAGVESADTSAFGTTPHWSRETATAGDIDWVTGAVAPGWYLQPRDLYGSSAATTSWKARVRYRTSNATACDLGLYLEAGSVVGDAWVPAAAATRQVVTLAGTSGAWAWASADVTVPRSELVRVVPDATGPGAAQLLSLSCVALIEQEP